MSNSPRYRQIADDLRRRLEADGFQVGDKLPPIAELQKRRSARRRRKTRLTCGRSRSSLGVLAHE
jgi:DNA-binding transcriptional MocR family regulator